VWACTRRQAVPGSPAIAEIKLERICDEALGGDVTASDRLVRELCIELVSASPLLDDQALTSCQTKRAD
jgi:hypothetical protein